MLAEYRRGENNRITNAVYTRHLTVEDYELNNPVQDYKIIKAERDLWQRRLIGEFEMPKERETNVTRFTFNEHTETVWEWREILPYFKKNIKGNNMV